MDVRHELAPSAAFRVEAMDQFADVRFPAVAAKAGHYESWYLKAADPEGRHAVWIRYTVHKRPGEAPEGSIWFTFFDADGGRPYAVKQTAGPGALYIGRGSFIEIGELGGFTPKQAFGQISGEGRSAEWKLEIAGGEELLAHLPGRLYSTPLPRTKLLTVAPAALFSGQLDAAGQRWELSGWNGMIGHNWGTQHAECWVWLHGADFEDRGKDTWIDIALGRVKVGPWTTPWVANGAISIDGVRHRLGGLGGVRATKVDTAAGHCTLALPGEGLTLTGSTRAPAADTVAWRYADPDGSEHHTLNCSISELELSVSPRQGAPIKLRTQTGATYEYGSRETGHGIPVEPFSDG
jgi:hypothetical protein